MRVCVVGFSAGRVMGLMYAIIGVIEGQCWILNEALGSWGQGALS